MTKAKVLVVTWKMKDPKVHRPSLVAFIKHFIGKEQLTYISGNISIGTKGSCYKEYDIKP